MVPFDPAAAPGSAPAAGPWQISDQGGSGKVFRRKDGKELYYVDLGAESGIVAVPLGGPNADLAGAARTLFRSSSRVRDFDVTSDAQRFLINQDIDTTTRTLVHVVVNWPALLRH